jgi:hypothetical protein
MVDFDTDLLRLRGLLERHFSTMLKENGSDGN